MNADQIIYTEKVLGSNVFAYCLNNPVKKSDPSGYFAAEAALTWGAVFLLGVLFFWGAQKTGETIKEFVESKENIRNVSANSVYVLTDPNDGNRVKYVGRSKNPDRRIKEHRKNEKHPERKVYNIKIVATDLTLSEAKLCEQSLISSYTIGYLDNARREIAVNNLDGFFHERGAVASLFDGV